MTRPSPSHIPVLPEECLRLLDPRPGHFYIDGTIGTGAHARLILEASPGLRLVGFDRDAEAVRIATESLADHAERVAIVHDNFKNWRHHSLPDLPLGGCLLDLGISSVQIEQSGRGFSFSRDERLDMRMDPRGGPSAAEILNASSPEELQRVFEEYGEVPFARRLAREIVARRHSHPFARTADLLGAIYAVAHRSRSHHPATLPFMALRIAANDELAGLDHFLREVAEALAPGGRLVVISFHSLEDRIVKHTFRALTKGEAAFETLTRKPIVAGPDERAQNPRARSAKLRALARPLPDSTEPEPPEGRVH